MNPIKESELIFNPDGSIYHLNLLPEEIADTIITVGDPDRVNMVTKHFDTIEVQKQKREFHTITGILKNKRLTVISTGIGTDNIDIVFNELDALANIDFSTRTIKPELKELTFVRLGTSGCLHSDIPLDSYLLSSFGLSLDGLLGFYKNFFDKQSNELLTYLKTENRDFIDALPVGVYLTPGSSKLIQHFHDENTNTGITATCPGFYGPQGRMLRLQPFFHSILDELKSLKLPNSQRVTNFEMETAGIYGLATLLGHKALSVNLMIANRPNGTFSKNPIQSMEQMIDWALKKIVAL